MFEGLFAILVPFLMDIRHPGRDPDVRDVVVQEVEEGD
jgi:hypothetical protein